MKCPTSLSSLVNILDRLMFPWMYFILTNLFWTNSQTAFLWICIWWSPLDIRFTAYWTQVALLLYIVIGWGMIPLDSNMPSTRRGSWSNFLTHSSVVYILAFTELHAVMVCLLDSQCIGSLYHKRKPKIDLDLNKSSGVLFVSEDTIPQIT